MICKCFVIFRSHLQRSGQALSNFQHVINNPPPPCLCYIWCMETLLVLCLTCGLQLSKFTTCNDQTAFIRYVDLNFNQLSHFMSFSPRCDIWRSFCVLWFPCFHSVSLTNLQCYLGKSPPHQLRYDHTIGLDHSCTATNM